MVPHGDHADDARRFADVLLAHAWGELGRLTCWLRMVLEEDTEEGSGLRFRRDAAYTPAVILLGAERAVGWARAGRAVLDGGVLVFTSPRGIASGEPLTRAAARRWQGEGSSPRASGPQ